jgi:hypothetical protein
MTGGMILTDFAEQINDLKIARYYLAFTLLAALMYMGSWITGR